MIDALFRTDQPSTVALSARDWRRSAIHPLQPFARVDRNGGRCPFAGVARGEIEGLRRRRAAIRFGVLNAENRSEPHSFTTAGGPVPICC